MFEVIKTEGTARRGRFRCAHGGEVQTPVFMNVGTQGAIKGGIDAFDLKELGCQIELSNTYHLHLRPGDDVVRQMGGLHRFMRWDGPILTDSGGFQVFSLAGLRKITEEGVTFASHLDGHRIFMGPEESMQIQSHLGSDIAMAFDECVENPAQYDYAKASCERTLRWLERCKAEHDRLNALPDTVNPHQMLFGINQGATYRDLRIWHMQQIAKLNCDGYAIGGLAVGGAHGGDVRHHRGGGALYAQGQAPVSHGCGDPQQHHRGRGPWCGFLRLRYAGPQRPTRKALYMAGFPEHQKCQVQAG